MIGQSLWKVWAVRAAAAVLVLAAASPVSAQAKDPRWEAFGGYSFLSATGSDFPRGASHGVEGEIAFKVSRWFSAGFSVGAQFDRSDDLGVNFPGVKASSSVTQYLAVPRFIARTDRADFFAHALVGIAAGRTNLGGFSDSGFALGAGGGVDVRINRRLAVRGHMEILGGLVDIMETDVRAGAGLVIRLGR
jgi:hypothetical protein